jgi:CHASE2 domain-containing sensor protein/two-component sensor histidine kinase
VDKFKAIILGSLPSLAVIIGLLALRGVGAMQSLELMAFDQLLRLRPKESIDSRVVIIGIQENDLQQLGRYPVTDQVLAETIQAISRLKPAAIGVDIFRDFAVPPGENKLKEVIQTTPDLFIAYRHTPDRFGTKIAAPSIATPEQQGFVDVQLDPDGNLRRLLMGFQDDRDIAHSSLSAQLAGAFLAKQDQELEATDQGLQMGDRLYPFVSEQFGAYQKIDAGGDQLMLNPRQRHRPFQQFSLTAVQQGKLKPSDIEGKVVLIGLTAISVKDTVNAMGVLRRSNGQVNGVEVQAHAVSQLLSATLDRRPLIQSWPDAVELIWIISCGVMGVLVGRLTRSPIVGFIGLVVGLSGIVGLSYGLLIFGWWIPLVPAALAFFANASGFVAAQIYQQEQDLRLRLRDRQQLLEQTFTAVHNGPLQDLAGLARQIQDALPSQAVTQTVITNQIQQINQELRGIFESSRFALLQDQPELYLSNETKLNLQAPLHELLEQVYNETCARELSGLGLIKVKIVQFQPIDAPSLSLDQKQALCRFLEEALCNVGKHAPSATKLWVNCGTSNSQQVICVKDNGRSVAGTGRSGSGTKQAKRLARQLRGKFQRLPNSPQGTVCQIIW